MGVAIAVAGTSADHTIGGTDGTDEIYTAGGIAAVVAHLQHIAAQICTGDQKIRFSILFHITGEKETHVAVLDHHHDGGVVDIGVLFDRADDGDGQLLVGICIAHRGDGQRKTLAGDGRHIIAVGVGAVGFGGSPYLLHFKRHQNIC